MVNSFEGTQRVIHAQDKKNELYHVGVWISISVTRSWIVSPEYVEEEFVACGSKISRYWKEV
jgi:hypothetical protein